jgi:hypothetical protein
VRLYAKSDGRLYLKDDAGSEVQLDPSGLAVLKSLYDAYSVLVANVNDTPVVLSLSAGQMIGRLRSGGDIVAFNSDDIIDVQAPSVPYIPISQRWYDGTFPVGVQSTSTAAFTIQADRLYAFPFWCPRSQAWDRIGVNVFTLEAGKKAKLGIFSMGTDGYPATRLFGGTEFDLGSTGSKEEALSLTTDAGMFYLALRSDTAGAVVFTRKELLNNRIFGAVDTTTIGGSYVYSDTGTYAGNGIPSSFPSSPSINTVQSGPRIMLRAA